LNRRVNSFELENASLRRSFEELTARYDLVIGFESLPELPQNPNLISAKVQNATVRDVLNTLTAKDIRYTWKPSDHSINVYPIIGNQEWMETVIDHFTVNNVNRDEAVDALLSSPKIQPELGSAGIRRAEIRSLPGVVPSDLSRFSLDLYHATPRAILNAIAKADHSGVWTFLRYGTNNEYFSIVFTNLITRVRRRQ